MNAKVEPRAAGQGLLSAVGSTGRSEWTADKRQGPGNDTRDSGRAHGGHDSDLSLIRRRGAVRVNSPKPSTPTHVAVEGLSVETFKGTIKIFESANEKCSAGR